MCYCFYDNMERLLTAGVSHDGGTATRVLGDTTVLVRSIYYDHHGNAIQSHESHALGGYEHTYSHLAFTGKPLQVLQVHTTAETVTYYDALGRKEEVVQRSVMVMLKQVLITKASVQQKLCKPNTMPSLLEHC